MPRSATRPTLRADDSAPAAPTGPNSGYRRDVQGLRAVSVIAVVLYHLDGALPGGFVGVDMFFVISGFVIGRRLLDEHASAGRIDLRAVLAAKREAFVQGYRPKGPDYLRHAGRAVRVGETEVTALSDARRRSFRAREIGFIFQDFALLEYLTARENILYPYRISRGLTLTRDVRAVRYSSSAKS